ncbi:uncharacterized protein LOC130644831 [Hydractinia symbiolongicarpus]|uniref:uncharacterized protein LOC130644831 n=1 Tax=Hydractinia symbiolongicarpus TaxID=13093 RepID=UPI0025500EC1|nr:uncharacterized protein LOC130644831 [Hydractinia symbiolongicarpus]
MGSGASNMFSQNPMKRNLPSEDVPSFKIVLVGDSNVGKSSIFLRFTKEQFDYSYQPTMNVNIGNVTKKVQLPFETLVSLAMWDLPGREEIDLRRSYYKDIDAAIVVVDLTDEGSIDMAGTWKQDVLNNSFYTEQSEHGEKIRKKSMKSQMQVPILLLGNKLDQISNDAESLNQPIEIQMLEDTALQHNFVGCVAVSARDSDGGVHAAIRSLVRYLLQKKMPKKIKQQTSESTNLKDVFSDPNQHGIFARNLGSVDDHAYEQLKICRIKKFDDIFTMCDKQIKQVEICCVSLLIAVKNFKRACCVSGVTDTYKASIEECVTGLKDSLRHGEEEILIAIEEAGFIKLKVGNNSSDIPGPIKRVLDIYDKEVGKTTKRVLTQCPTLKINITDHLNELSALEGSALDKATNQGLNKKQAKISLQVIKDNMVRISDTIELANESMKVTDDQFKKIKNAMMW